MLTTEDTRARFSREEVKRAEDAARLARNLGHPSSKVLHRMLRAGNINGTKATAKDFDSAVDMKGKRLSTGAKWQRTTEIAMKIIGEQMQKGHSAKSSVEAEVEQPKMIEDILYFDDQETLAEEALRDRYRYVQNMQY